MAVTIHQGCGSTRDLFTGIYIIYLIGVSRSTEEYFTYTRTISNMVG